MITPYLDHLGVIAMAHRGFTGRGAPENSLAAFGAAVDLGFSYVETDVHATSDGVLLAFHDDKLDRVTDSSGEISQLPWSTVRQAKIAGTHEIPTLDAVLDSWPDLRVNIDCKSAGAVAPLADAIERHSAHDRVCVASFSDKRRRAVLRRLSKPVATSGGQSVITRFVLGMNSLAGIDCLQVPQGAGPVPVVTARMVRRAHADGTQVHVWTIDEPDDMHRLLDLGVDGLITDRADTLKNVLQQRGQWD
ncbi:glycerophosphodiester phosphodiesterase [Flexivirga meconopsidis]|uniref:glycerophosphodiester phosphodiesterase n=1 Tax=Flexivirga meconopsidis TaxID=2977121 RepID=UPI00223F39B2